MNPYALILSRQINNIHEYTEIVVGDFYSVWQLWLIPRFTERSDAPSLIADATTKKALSAFIVYYKPYKPTANGREALDPR